MCADNTFVNRHCNMHQIYYIDFSDFVVNKYFHVETKVICIFCSDEINNNFYALTYNLDFYSENFIIFFYPIK